MTNLYCPNCHRQLHEIDIKMGICAMCGGTLDAEKFIGVDTEEIEDKTIKTYGDIYKEFCSKFPNLEVVDYRPATETYVPQLSTGIPNAIIVWLKGGSYVIYKAKSEEE